MIIMPRLSLRPVVWALIWREISMGKVKTQMLMQRHISKFLNFYMQSIFINDSFSHSLWSSVYLYIRPQHHKYGKLLQAFFTKETL